MSLICQFSFSYKLPFIIPKICHITLNKRLKFENEINMRFLYSNLVEVKRFEIRFEINF